METVTQGNSPTSFGEGSSFSSAFADAVKEASSEGAVQQESTMDRLASGQEGIIKDQQKTPAEQVEQESDTEIEYEGKKYKVEKSAKDYLKEMLDAKKGMRKGFSERDSIKKQLEEIGKKGSKWDQIESIFKAKGEAGLFDALAGKEGAWAEKIKQIEEKAVRKYNATAEELAILEREEEMSRARERAEIAERMLKEQMDKIEAEKQAANKEILMGKISKAFEDVSFAGKLGDEKRETKFDKYVWEQARIQLNDYAKEKGIDGHEIPSKVISAIFQDVAADFGDTIRKQAQETAENAIAKKSEAATLAAQSRSTTARTKAKSIEELADAHSSSIGKGSLSSFMRDLFG